MFLCATCFTPHTEFILDFDLCFRWPYFAQIKMSEFPLKSFQLCQGQSLPVPWASISLGWYTGTPWAISICCPLGPASSVVAGDRVRWLLVPPSHVDGRDLGS